MLRKELKEAEKKARSARKAVRDAENGALSPKTSAYPERKRKSKKLSSFIGESVKNQRHAQGAKLHPLHEHPLKEVRWKGLKWACDGCMPVPAEGETQQYPLGDNSKRYRCVFVKKNGCDFDVCEQCFKIGQKERVGLKLA